MKWPSPQDYREAIQHPKFNLSDPQLKQAQIELDPLQLPIVQSGNYATVFKLTTDKSSWAVRCFLHNFEDREERYQAIYDFIEETKLEYTVGFEFIEKGIRVASNWYPILKMEYLEGTALGTYLAKKPGTEALRNLQSKFEEMMFVFKEHGIAHGDLQHDNIIVSAKQELRLIDYDCMYVPSLKGKFSNELGHANFQHPSRNSMHCGPYLDNFSAWIIREAICSIAENPSLIEAEDALLERMLLSRNDFMAPDTSRTFFALENAGGASDLFSKRIRTLLRSSPDEIPYLDEEIRILDELPAIVPAALPAPISTDEPLLPGLSNAETRMKSVLQKNFLPGFPTELDYLYTAEPYSDPAQYRDELKARIQESLKPGEELLWTGGFDPLELELERANRLNQPASVNFANAMWCWLGTIVAVLGSFSVKLEFSILGVVVFLLFFVAMFGLSVLGFSQFVVGIVVLLTPVGKIKLSSAPRTLLYALTNKNLMVCAETARSPGSENWKVEITSVPLSFIWRAVFYESSITRNKVDLIISDLGKMYKNIPCTMERLNEKELKELQSLFSKLRVINERISSRK